jgi:hypothetical protein
MLPICYLSAQSKVLNPRHTSLVVISTSAFIKTPRKIDLDSPARKFVEGLDLVRNAWENTELSKDIGFGHLCTWV